MARAIWSAFLLLVAFATGGFFTRMLTTYLHQENHYQLQLAKILDANHRSLISHATKESPSWITQPGLNRAFGPESASTDNSNHGTHHLPYPAKTSIPARILCWVMTSPTTLYTRATNVQETWGPRCDVTLYMSSQTDPDFPAIGLDVAEGRSALWNKTKSSFRYIFKHHLNDADWFMKADDDTYVIVENLRLFLQDKNSSAPVYYGHRFRPYIRQGYMSGGAGYVMSKEALSRLIAQLKAKKDCGAYQGMTEAAEDVTLGLCMMNSGVLAGDSRDEKNRSRFLPFDVETFFKNSQPDWYFKFSKYRVKKGRSCCSDSLITIHYVKDRTSMLLLDYYLHGLHVEPFVNSKNIVS
ncbi:glycoprotein-N-acetylgalactosamine 3-beta-galactosyltransferase 1-like [Acanthaster planci]|uniref:Glycoprotein-N-acetylgalactosamine 3-beta-galactosyltransferase 1 n=1 Tax=Acanthaster planci TaxID=133434 RepID=A0A8B7Y3R4_ACAPL|nr:glycoprotein-N-acetylgalactosamine 3-beta-galactosyltransferase 1-like [Acanthaster planci]